MLYLVINDKKQANWQTKYEANYIEMLKLKNYPFTLVNSNRLSDLSNEARPDDFIWIMHYQDLLNQDLKDTKAKVIFRISGTATHPYCYQVNLAEERYLINDVIDINLSFNSRLSDYMQKFYPNAFFANTGYPLTDCKTKIIRVDSQRKNRIVIGGRLSPDKQPMLAMNMLQDIAKNYEIVFCYPNNGGKDDYWLQQYGGKERYEALGFKFEQHSQESWIEILKDSKFCFTCSLGDIVSVSIVEACENDCYPIVPRIKSGLPLYDSYLDNAYLPFDKIEALSLIHFADKYFDEMRFDCTYLNKTLWVDRFIEMLAGNRDDL